MLHFVKITGQRFDIYLTRLFNATVWKYSLGFYFFLGVVGLFLFASSFQILLLTRLLALFIAAVSSSVNCLVVSDLSPQLFDLLYVHADEIDGGEAQPVPHFQDYSCDIQPSNYIEQVRPTVVKEQHHLQIVQEHQDSKVGPTRYSSWQKQHKHTRK